MCIGGTRRVGGSQPAAADYRARRNCRHAKPRADSGRDGRRLRPTRPKTPQPTRRPRPSADASPTAPPDIDVSVYSYQITPHADDPAAGYYVDLDITIENTGTDRARRFTVAATCLGYTQDQDVFGGIDAGGQYVISFGYYLSIPGDKANKIVLDSTDRLVETDEGNNTFELLSAPDEYPESCDREAGAPTLP